MGRRIARVVRIGKSKKGYQRFKEYEQKKKKKGSNLDLELQLNKSFRIAETLVERSLSFLVLVIIFEIALPERLSASPA